MIAALLLLLVFAALYQLRFAARRRRPAQTWQEILVRLEQVNTEGLQSIADGYLHPDGKQGRLEPPLMWELVGGDEGLKRMGVNAGLMLELAALAEQWNETEGIIVGEMLRRDALRLRRAVRRIRWGMLWDGAGRSAAFQLEEAASAYWLMAGRLLGLYRVAHAGALPALEAALKG